jgi:alpha-beta hydrolase superfamily lysophospholipase
MTEHTARVCAEHHFTTHDGLSLFYRHWPAIHTPRRGAIVLFHGGHEHGARMAHLVDELDLPDFDFFAWDARDHGRSAGPRGHSPGFAASVRDVQSFVEHLGAAHGVPERALYLIAQSTGAVPVSTWVHDHAPRLRGLTLASPAFSRRRDGAFRRAGLGLMQTLRGASFVKDEVPPQRLTHDPQRIASHESDPLIAQAIAVDVLLERHAAAERVVADAGAIVLPVQLLVSGADRVAHRQPQQAFFDRLGSAVKTRMDVPGFFHDVLGERERAPVVAAVRGFILEGFETTPPAVEPPAAPAAAPGAEAPRGALAHAGVRLGGMFSRGLRLGRDTGFDSERTREHIDRNVPEGTGALGRWIDRRFLNTIGPRGLRQRKAHVQELLREAMERLAEQHREVRVMDIAAGTGRDLLDAVLSSPVKATSILLRDPSEAHVRAGPTLFAEKEVQHLARFVQADPFDRMSLARVTPRPTLALVCGLYEGCPDDESVRRSLQGVGDAVEDRGYLVYTAQPGQPPFAGRRRDDALPVRRSQAEMDRLVEEAGFRKIAQRIDAWGLFSVCLAIRTGH